MRVFLSSTVFDLIDVRNEIAELLRSLGITPVLSDDKLSDFEVRFDVNSIETCLINVANCDEVIVVLDKRYGPSLGSAGFDDISATHLEYRHAVKHKKPIHFYVRDRLEADYSIWKKNPRKKELNLTWVQSNKDYGLFKMLAEHRKPKARSKTSNWFTPFTSSVDLKASLQRRFEASVLPQRLVDALHDHRFPLFDVDVDVEYMPSGPAPCLSLKCTVSNIGGAAAFNFIAHWDHDSGDKNSEAIMAPGQSLLLSHLYMLGPQHMETKKHLWLEYESAIGIAVVDDFYVSGRVELGPQPMIMKGARLEKRKFRRAERPVIEIDDS